MRVQVNFISGTRQVQYTIVYQIRRPLGLAFVISFCWLGELFLFYI
jgi:hypothetical protein